MNSDLLASRRRFLLHSSALLVVPATLAIGPAAHAGNDQTLTLTATDHDLFRVRITMEVEGNVNVPKNPLVSRTSAIRIPIKSGATFDYEERYARRGGEVPSLHRFYHQAQSDSRVNRGQSTIKLRPSVQETVIHRNALPEVIHATDDYFQREELDLLRIPASSAAVDAMLPTEAVKVGSTYQPSRQRIASLMNLSSVEASDVTAEVVAITDEDVKIQFRGKVDGSVDGVPTIIRTIGKLTFDRAAHTCTWLAMAIHETREIGIAEPGFDVAATIKMVRKPLEATMALPPKPRSIPAEAPADRLYVDLRSDELGISALMDRRWRVMSDLAGSAMMRMIDNDRSIAQCDFRSLVALEPGSEMSLEGLQNEVRQTLGEQLTELVEADQRQMGEGIRVLRVTANGAVQGVPIHWIMLHFSDASGRRVLATFTMEGDRRQAFGGSDAQLASSFRFLPQTGQASSGESSPPAATSENEVASAKIGADSDGQVQSSSDLK